MSATFAHFDNLSYVAGSYITDFVADVKFHIFYH